MIDLGFTVVLSMIVSTITLGIGLTFRVKSYVAKLIMLVLPLVILALLDVALVQLPAVIAHRRAREDSGLVGVWKVLTLNSQKPQDPLFVRFAANGVIHRVSWSEGDWVPYGDGIGDFDGFSNGNVAITWNPFSMHGFVCGRRETESGILLVGKGSDRFEMELARAPFQ